MAKFNKTTKNVTVETTNMAGGVSYERNDPRKEIVSVILNSMLNGDTYYETEEDRMKRIESLLITNIKDAEFLAKTMVYVRNEGNLRSISHLMGVILSENVKGETFMKQALLKSLVRPDDATEMLSLWNERNRNKMIPNVLRKGIKSSLEKRWDAYQLRKYYGNGNSVKVSNLIQIAHPKPRDENQRLTFKQALEGTLPNIDTAQTINASSKGENRVNNYFKVILEGKLGYMATLKNLSNILSAMVDMSREDKELMIDKISDLLRNKKACLKSRVLPFRFVQAFETVNSMNIDRILSKKLISAIEDGFILSAGNVSIVEEGESIAILLDESGSMGWSGDAKEPFDIGKTLMASMLTGLDKSKTIGYLWASRTREVSVDGSPFEFIKNTKTHGGGTDVWSPMSKLIESKTYVDKLVILTDMQMYSVGGGNRKFADMVTEYRKINPNVKVLFWNLNGYAGGTPTKLTHNILEVSGYSDKMLDVISKIWQDKDALIKEIEKIDLTI